MRGQFGGGFGPEAALRRGQRGVKMLLPTDVVVADKFAEGLVLPIEIVSAK